MTGVPNAVLARSFDAWAPEYDRYRPGYPAQLFDEISARLALSERPIVVDVGAGTGLATLAMARRGWRMTAVEPGEPMLDVLRVRAADAGVTVAIVLASAEATRLPDASADLATAAQAFHWFDPVPAIREMGRIVRPGGGIALFWNVRDDAASPFLAEYTRLLVAHGIQPEGRGPGRHRDTRRSIARAGGFDASEFFQVRHTRRMPAEEFIGLMFTASYVRAQPDDVQARLAADVRTLLERQAPAGEPVEVPYVVDCEIARRTDR